MCICLNIQLLTKLWVRTLHQRSSPLSLYVFYPEQLYETLTAITSSPFPLSSLLSPLSPFSISFHSSLQSISLSLLFCTPPSVFPLTSASIIILHWFHHEAEFTYAEAHQKKRKSSPTASVTKVPGRTPIDLPKKWDILSLNMVIRYI